MHALDNPEVLGDREQHAGVLALEHLYGCSAGAIRALAKEADESSPGAVRRLARRLARDLVRLRRGEIDVIELPKGLPPDDE